MRDVTQFHLHADQMLEKLSHYITEQYDHAFECDLLEGVLTIECPLSLYFVLNKHEPSQQIWMSSPVSGANYFDYREGEWQDKHNQLLAKFLLEELDGLVAE